MHSFYSNQRCPQHNFCVNFNKHIFPCSNMVLKNRAFGMNKNRYYSSMILFYLVISIAIFSNMPLEEFLHFRILNLPGVKNMQILNVLKTLYILKSFLSLHLKSEVSSEIPLRYFTFLFLQKPLWLLNFNLPPYHEYIIIITIMILKKF